MAHDNKSQPPPTAPPVFATPLQLRSGLIKLIAGIALLLCGGYGLASPWMRGSPVWDWIIQYEEDLVGAEINADVSSSDGFAPVFHRRGDRHISIISRPVTVHGNGRPVVQVIATDVVDPPGAGRRRMIVFWQTGPNEPYRMLEAEVEPGAGRLAPIFILPIDARAIYRIGVQIPDALEARIHGIVMNPPNYERVSAGLSEIAKQEPFGGESVNFYKGPNLLGEGLNRYMMSSCGVVLGLLLVVSSLRGRRVRPSYWVLAVLIPWMVGDLYFSTQLCRRATTEAAALRPLEHEQRLIAVYGEGTAIAAEWLRIIPIASRVCVLSPDATTTGHRLAYLAAPNVVLVERPADAEYIVLMEGGGTLVDEHALQPSGANETIAIRVIERWAGGALLERVRD